MKSLERLIYVSESRLGSPLSAEARQGIDAIVASASARNKRHHVTGVLAYGQHHFIQVLEGAPDVLDATLAIIIADRRHQNLVLAYRAPIPERQFAEWSLADGGHAVYLNRMAEDAYLLSSEIERQHWAARAVPILRQLGDRMSPATDG